MKKINSNIESLNISYDNLINKQNNIEESTERLLKTINNSKMVLRTFIIIKYILMINSIYIRCN